MTTTPAGSAAGPSSPRVGRREELIDAAEAAVRRHGPDVSMAAVAAEAGVTKPILYRHVGDRRAVLGAVAHRHAERLLDRLRTALAGQAHPRERVRITVDTYLDVLERDPDLHRLAARAEVGPGSGAALQEAATVISAEVTADVEASLQRAGRTTSAASTWGTAIVGMAQLVGHRWLEDPTVERRVLVEQLTDLLWHGLAGAGREEAAPPR